MPVDGDAAAGGETGRQEAHHSLGDQTLAAAGLADQEQDGAGLKRQVDIADQSGAAPVPDRQSRKGQCGRGHHISSGKAGGSARAWPSSVAPSTARKIARQGAAICTGASAR